MNLEDYPVERIFVSRDPQTARDSMSLSERFVRRIGLMPREDFRCYSDALSSMRPRFIHAHFGWEGYFALGLMRKHNLPLVTRFYGYDVGTLPRLPLWRKRYRQLFLEGDLFIVEGCNMKSILVDLGCPTEKIAVNHLGVELDQIGYEPRSLIPNTLRILIAATFKEKKGLEYAIRAIAAVRSIRPVRRFRFFGQSDKLMSTGPKRNETWA